MDASSSSLHRQKEWQAQTIGPADMGFILPLFPGDVRDTNGRQRGGPEAPVHLSRFTLPCSAATFQADDVSSGEAMACAASR